jgi:hypothetical protein
VKPSNIMVLPTGAVKVLDFGIAWAPWWTPLTEATEVQGTALYCSPEQVRGLPVDARSDIYSLGVVLFEMLAGHPPFMGENAFAIARQHVDQPPPPLPTTGGIADQLTAVVRRCLSKRPEDRFPHARKLAAELRHLTGPEVTTRPLRSERTDPLPAAPRRLRPWRRAALASVLTLVVALVWTLAGSLLSSRPRAIALDAPRGLTAHPGCAGFMTYGVALKWRPARHSQGYVVVRRSQDGGRYRRVAVLRGRSRVTYEDTELASGKTYEYGVRSLNEAQTSRLSRTVLVTTQTFCFG